MAKAEETRLTDVSITIADISYQILRLISAIQLRSWLLSTNPQTFSESPLPGCNLFVHRPF
jgi:hypothetical protein